MHTGEDPYNGSLPVCQRARTEQAVAPCMVWRAMHVHACHAWHTWDGMDSVEDLTQDKQPVLVTQRSKWSLLVRSRWPLLKRWGGPKLQLSRLGDSFRAGRGGSGGSPSSPSVVVVRDVDGDGRELDVTRSLNSFINFKYRKFLPLYTSRDIAIFNRLHYYEYPTVLQLDRCS